MTTVTEEMLNAKFDIFQAEMDGRFATMDVKLAELKAEMRKNTTELIKWVVGNSDRDLGGGHHRHDPCTP